MDISYLINCLETLIVAGRRVPLTTKVLMDEADLVALVDQMHAVVPDEIVEAHQIVIGRDGILEAAQQDSEEILRRATQQAEQLVGEQAIVVEAEKRAVQVISEAEADAAHLRAAAEADAKRLRAGAEEYATGVLTMLEDTLTGQLSQVRRGRAALKRPTGRSARATS